MQAHSQPPPKLHWPFVLMMIAVALSLALIAIVIMNPTGVTGSYGSINAAPH